MFFAAAVWAKRTGNTVTLVSANDHIHVDESLHYEDRALDFHSTDLGGLAMFLKSKGYRVLYQVPGHYAHVHSEDIGRS